jgi:hypothetical protein
LFQQTGIFYKAPNPDSFLYNFGGCDILRLHYGGYNYTLPLRSLRERSSYYYKDISGC